MRESFNRTCGEVSSETVDNTVDELVKQLQDAEDIGTTTNSMFNLSPDDFTNVKVPWQHDREFSWYHDNILQKLFQVGTEQNETGLASLRKAILDKLGSDQAVADAAGSEGWRYAEYKKLSDVLLFFNDTYNADYNSYMDEGTEDSVDESMRGILADYKTKKDLPDHLQEAKPFKDDMIAFLDKLYTEEFVSDLLLELLEAEGDSQLDENSCQIKVAAKFLSDGTAGLNKVLDYMVTPAPGVEFDVDSSFYDKFINREGFNQTCVTPGSTVEEIVQQLLDTDSAEDFATTLDSMFA